jgi:hypothetical protein
MEVGEVMKEQNRKPSFDIKTGMYVKVTDDTSVGTWSLEMAGMRGHWFKVIGTMVHGSGTKRSLTLMSKDYGKPVAFPDCYISEYSTRRPKEMGSPFGDKKPKKNPRGAREFFVGDTVKLFENDWEFVKDTWPEDMFREINGKEVEITRIDPSSRRSEEQYLVSGSGRSWWVGDQHIEKIVKVKGKEQRVERVEVPYISFPSSWLIRMVSNPLPQPQTHALHFYVRKRQWKGKGTGDECVSVVLFNKGIYGAKAVWEVFPTEEDGCEQCACDDVSTMLIFVTKALNIMEKKIK